jgi:hypothetical protein
MFAELRRIRDEVLGWFEDYYHYLESTEGGTEFEEEFAKWCVENSETLLREVSVPYQEERRYLGSLRRLPHLSTGG